MKKRQIIVVKIGTNSLTERSGSLCAAKLRALTGQIADLHDAGHAVVLVTSAAIAAGYPLLGYHERPKSVSAKQAAAAVGQGLLMEAYTKVLSERGIVAGQILLTRDDFRDKRRYTNAFNALEVLLSRGAIPIINENDSVSIAELKLGDNDMLSAQVAAMLHADLLILATDTDGLYTADPRENPDAKHIPLIEKITPEIEALAGGAGTTNSVGGMATKLRGAKLATSAGVPVVICRASDENVFRRAVAAEARGTYFTAQKSMKTRLQWMAFYAPVTGRIFIDSGAAAAIMREGHSLLPAGLLRAEGDFEPGDLVEVFKDGDRGAPLGRGIINYSAEELSSVMGLPTRDAGKLFPHRKPEVIHRDNWVCATDADEEDENSENN